MTENQPQPKPSFLLEFERHPEMAGVVVKEVEPEIFEGLDFLDDYEQRQQFYVQEHTFLTNNTPNTANCINRLSEACAHIISPRDRKRAYSCSKQKKKIGQERLDNIAKYFKLGSYFGSFAYRLQFNSRDNPVAPTISDLPQDISGEILGDKAFLSYEHYSKLFELIKAHDDALTWQLSWSLDKVPVYFATPWQKCKNSLNLGALTAYHLHSLADWHRQGKEHESSLSVDYALYEQIGDPERLSEQDKRFIESLISSMPATARLYKKTG